MNQQNPAQTLQENEPDKPEDQSEPKKQPSTGKLSVKGVYGIQLDNAQVLQENLPGETIAKLQSAQKQLFGNLTDTQWNGLLADSILGKSAKLESMLKTELRTAETMLQEAEAVGDAALQQQAQEQINSIREVQAQILEAKGRRAQTQAGAGGVGSATPEGGLTDAPNNGTIGDKESAPAEGKENAAYNAYLRMLDELEAARRSGMTARDFAISKGVPSTLTDEEAVFLDSNDIRLQSKGAGENFTTGSFDDLPSNAQDSYKGYEGNGWNGNYSGQAPGTKAGKMYQNADDLLPKTDSAGNRITYREFDINSPTQGVGRDAERFVVGSDGSVYYTDSHYGQRTSPAGLPPFVKIK